MTVNARARRPLIIAATAALVLSLAAGLVNLSTPAHSQDSVTVPAPAGFAGPVSFADVVERVSPAVVDIAVESVATVMPTGRQQFDIPLPEGAPLDDFFGRFFGGPGEGQAPMQRRRQGLGTGFVIDADGYIVTNHHVIDGAQEVTVRFNDGSTYPAEVIGRDAKTDLALVKIDPAHELPYIELGDSDSVRVGDWVLAIGNPFGLGGSATVGIVSARGRDIQSGPYDDYMQIDAAINSGNSGGPVFNAAGEVVGISTAIFSPNGGNVGIGFAIPSNQAAAIIEPLRESGSVSRGWLGVQIQDIDEDLAAALELGEPRGALVVDVTAMSPAERAGLVEGDVITRVGDTQVEDAGHLARLVAGHAPGARLRIDVSGRDGARELEVSLGNADTGSAVPARQALTDNRGGRGPIGDTALGLQLDDLTGAQRNELGLPPARGALVMSVAPESQAAEKGLSRGDVIVQVNREPVASAADALIELQRAESSGRRALLLVRRGQSQRYVAIGPA